MSSRAQRFALTPHLAELAGATVVVKYGGHAMTDPTLAASFADDVLFLADAGVRVVVVHGGGPQINQMLSRLGVTSEFVAGLRVTTPEVMDVVRMVLVGSVNRELVGALNREAGRAVGMSGEDGNLLLARRTGARVDGTEVDLGLVGDVTSVRTDLLRTLLDAGTVPVIATVARDDGAGGVLNVNADTAAGAVAAELVADRLVVLTDVPGLYRDWPAATDLVSTIGSAELEPMIDSLDAGMIPKMSACLRAVRAGVPAASVVDGRVPEAVLTTLLTDTPVGTTVIR
jgi:acetylglutamate kinase